MDPNRCHIFVVDLKSIYNTFFLCTVSVNFEVDHFGDFYLPDHDVY